MVKTIILQSNLHKGLDLFEHISDPGYSDIRYCYHGDYVEQSLFVCVKSPSLLFYNLLCSLYFVVKKNLYLNSLYSILN